ncbi:MAG TPA: MFS domain-containing histidine kinase [Polyangia bacterium]
MTDAAAPGGASAPAAPATASPAPRRSLRAVVDGWFAEPPLEMIVEAASPTGWAMASAGVVATLALAGYPGQALFGIRFVPSLLAFVPTLLFAASDCVLMRRAHPPVRLARISNLIGCVAFQFYPLYLLATSKPVGMATFGAIFLLIAVYHGFFNRAALRMVPAALVTPAAVGVAFAVTGGRATIPLLALGAVGSASAVIAGGLALDLARRQRENQALRAAVQAQIDAEREQALGRFRESVVAASGHTHDMANQVQATVMCLAALESELRPPRAAQPAGPAVTEALSELRAGVAGLEDLVASARAELRVDRARLVHVDRVPPVAALATALIAVGRRFPTVELSCTEGDPAVVAVLRGGQEMLVRMLENLLLNACEGDGTRGATRVTCGVRLDASRGIVTITIADDGPGFAERLLARGIEGLATTKPGGTGLGLYTVERQLRASGGELRLRNRPAGGAEVQALLPAVPPPAAE